MATKADFTAEEWGAVLTSPMLAGMAVTLAEPNGLWGMLKEGMASGRALLEARSDASADELVKSVVAEMETSEGRTHARDGLKAELTGKSAAEIKQQIITVLERVGGIVDTKAPSDAAAFKAWLTHVAEKVAAASSEGGILGFGGVAVSDAEKATLNEIAQALRFSRS
jgi:hypothetical protein